MKVSDVVCGIEESIDRSIDQSLAAVEDSESFRLGLQELDMLDAGCGIEESFDRS